MRRVVLGATRLRLSRWAERPAPRTPSGDGTAAAIFFGGRSLPPLQTSPASVFHGIVSTLVVLGSAGWRWRGWVRLARPDGVFLFCQTSINIGHSSIILAYLQINSYLCTIKIKMFHPLKIQNYDKEKFCFAVVTHRIYLQEKS